MSPHPAGLIREQKPRSCRPGLLVNRLIIVSTVVSLRLTPLALVVAQRVF